MSIAQRRTSVPETTGWYPRGKVLSLLPARAQLEIRRFAGKESPGRAPAPLPCLSGYFLGVSAAFVAGAGAGVSAFLTSGAGAGLVASAGLAASFLARRAWSADLDVLLKDLLALVVPLLQPRVGIHDPHVFHVVDSIHLAVTRKPGAEYLWTHPERLRAFEYAQISRPPIDQHVEDRRRIDRRFDQTGVLRGDDCLRHGLAGRVDLRLHLGRDRRKRRLGCLGRLRLAQVFLGGVLGRLGFFSGIQRPWPRRSWVHLAHDLGLRPAQRLSSRPALEAGRRAQAQPPRGSTKRRA